jgi:hypothetical protein
MSDSDDDSDTKSPRKSDIRRLCLCKTVPIYYNYLQNRVNVRVRKLDAPDKDMFTIEMSILFHYKQVAYLLAERMHKEGFLPEPIDPLRIQLYRHHAHQDRPIDMPAQRSDTWQLQDILILPLNYNFYGKDSPIMYVEILAYSLTDLEKNFVLKIRCPSARKVTCVLVCVCLCLCLCLCVCARACVCDCTGYIIR